VDDGETRVKVGFPRPGVEAPDPGTPTLSFLEIPTEEPNFSSNSEPKASKLRRSSSFRLTAGNTTAAVEGCRHEFESLGVDIGDEFGEIRGEVWLGEQLWGEDEGDRRGEGNGNNSLSSSSAIGDALRGILMSCGEWAVELGEREGES
jgi:hypothetical protein